MGGFLGDLLSGNLSKAWEDIVKGFARLPDWLQSFISKMGTDEVAILSGLCNDAIADLMADIANPSALTTAQITAQAKAIFAKLVAQNVSTFTLQDVFSALNSALSAKAPSLVAPDSTPAAAS